MDITRLKEQTAVEHDRVEQSLPVMSVALDAATYIRTLQRLHGFVLGWERWASQSACPEIQRLLRSRRRSELLLADLLHFSACAPSETYEGPRLSPASLPQVLGAMYVMEGSTLGGQYIARHVESVLALSPGKGDAFFRGYGDATGSMWREIKTALTALPDDSEEEVIRAARTLFQDFAAWNEQPLSIPMEKILA